MSQHAHPRKPAGRVRVAEDLNASPLTEDRDRRLLRRSHKDARKRSENLRSVVVPAIGATSSYLANSMPYYSTFPFFNPSMYPPYNPPGVPPYMPLTFQYPVLPPILPSTAYDGEDHESSSEADKDSPPPYTVEEFNAATEDVCSQLIDTVLSTLVLEVVCGCIEEIVKSYLRQSKLLIEPPMERLNMGSDPIPTQIRRHSMPIQAGRGPPSNAGGAPPLNAGRAPPPNGERGPPLNAEEAPPPNVGRGPLLHLADLAAHPRPSSGPVAAVMARVQQPASDATRFNLESVDISQFGSEAELCHHVVTRMVDQLIFVHLVDMALDDGMDALVRVACESLLYDMMMAELLDRLI
ncbi:hypothetical protein EMCRGX_G034473 [Ephydatia muelleri]